MGGVESMTWTVILLIFEHPLATLILWLAVCALAARLWWRGLLG